ncbi:endoglucanase [Pseudorhodobacter antarcticus]|uniref:Endoglucanase n=1 Tax=Pseudorhodobacter antarcticus TaxID=1077947 RepID=A0A1H8MEM8_9RHOB|nr:glycosyl hydrolase [Pseudorhodobacter antarcticus]SEO15688.1 endoglucanase [Pseudorhodobacter antarcticus]
MKYTSFRSSHFAALAFAGVAIAAVATSQIDAQSLPPGDLPFGVYDPFGDYSDVSGVATEHLFMPWEDVFLPSLAEAEVYTKARGRNLLVTIEPWTWSRDERNSAKVLQKGIADGSYDDTMRTVCAALATVDVPMTIRWAQEMDDASGQFIWSGWAPQTYVAAYQKMIKICRLAAPKAKFMWSPLGNDSMASYYPGDDYVDVVGLTVFSLQPWEEAIMGRAQSFDDIFGPRYARALQFNKPIVIAELGYIGDSAHVGAWNAAVRDTAQNYPKLTSINYFNQQEVYPWPNGFGLPNWRRVANVLN